MDAVTLSTDAIGDLADRSFVVVRINTDQSPELTRRFEIRDLPALVFLSPGGLELLRMPNDYNNSAEKVLARMRAALPLARASAETERRLRGRVASEPESGSAHRELALLLQRGRDYRGARPLFDRAYKLLRRFGTGAGADQMLVEAAWINFKLRDFTAAEAAASTLLAEFPQSKHRARMAYYQGLALYHGKRDTARATEIWQALQRDHPGDPWAARAAQMIVKASRKR